MKKISKSVIPVDGRWHDLDISPVPSQLSFFYKHRTREIELWTENWHNDRRECEARVLFSETEEFDKDTHYMGATKTRSGRIYHLVMRYKPEPEPVVTKKRNWLGRLVDTK